MMNITRTNFVKIVRVTTLVTCITLGAAETNGTDADAESDHVANAFHDLSNRYSEIHGYVASVVCIFGVISNILNVIVLTRKHMISPANCILTALAVADFLTMLTYLVYAVYFYIATGPRIKFNHSIGWMYFILIHNYFIITSHNMALWFTITLAVFRYIFVCRSFTPARHCHVNVKRVVMIIIAVGVTTILLCVPNYFSYKIVPLNMYILNMSGYWIVDSDFVDENPIFKVILMWSFGVIMKIVPCIFLTVLSTLIILKMKRGIRQRISLLNQARAADHDVNHEHNRTTYMLMCVVICFVITEFPQGILAMISGLDEDFFKTIYIYLGDFLDLLVLLNSAVNFILYCGMSQRFRDTFRALFLGGGTKRPQNNRTAVTELCTSRNGDSSTILR